jgi:hypothetical protein
MSASASETKTLRERMSITTDIFVKCANRLGVGAPPTNPRADEDVAPINQLTEGFDILDGLGVVIQEQLDRL